MADKYKTAVKNAVESYLTKQNKIISRRNKKPEKDVECACLAWMRAQGWDVEIYEAKATYDPRRQCYRSQSVKAGTVDCQGVMPDGTFVAVEFKAKGKRSTFNLAKNNKQKDYLKRKIMMNAFGCVIDDVELLRDIFHAWNLLKTNRDKQDYLLSQLP